MYSAGQLVDQRARQKVDRWADPTAGWLAVQKAVRLADCWVDWKAGLRGAYWADSTAAQRASSLVD